ncbi:hypothetical protein Tco_0242206 [Tanacetum coccineum]
MKIGGCYTPKVSHLHAVKRIFRYLKGQSKLGLWYPGDSPFDLEAFSDSDYAGASLDRKSTPGGCQFLIKILISWQCKKQTIVANSTTEAEYVAAANYCGQTVIKEWEDRMERAPTTASSLVAEQDSGNINRTQSMATLNESFPQGTYSGSGSRCQDTILRGANAQIRINLLLSVLVYAARHTLTAVRHKLMLPALVDKKKAIITETSIRSDLKLNDAAGIDCLPTASFFAELERMGYEHLTQKLNFYKSYFSSQWKFLIHTILQCLSAKTIAWNEFSSTMTSAIICLVTNQTFNFSKYIFDNMVKHLEGGVKFLMYPRFVQVFLDKQVEGMTKHKEVYVTPSHTKKVFANMKRLGTGFSRIVTPLFPTMMIQASEDICEDSAAPSDSHSTPIIYQPSSSKPPKKKSRRKQWKDSGPTEHVTNETHVSTPSYDSPQSGEDSIQLSKLMNLCTSLQEKVLDLEKAKTAQAKKIASLKKRVKQLEKRRKLRNPGFKRFKTGRKIEDLDANAEVTLVNETQEMNDDNLMFDTCVLEEKEIKFEKVVEEPVVSVATTTKSIPFSTAEVVTTTSVEIPDELTLAQTLIEIKTAKPKPITTAVTTVKDKGKGKMVEPEKPLKKKDQIDLDEEMARNLKVQIKAKLIEEERLGRQKEEEANILMNRRKKHFAKLRAKEIRRKPRTKAQNRNQMSTYLKNMAGFKHSQLKSKRYDETQKLFDKEMKRVNTFVDMNSEVVKGSETRTEESFKKEGDELKYKIVKEGQKGFYHLIRADGSLKRYSSMIRMLQGIDKEDLETLWKLVKEKHGINRLVDEYERVLWGDFKVMFKSDIKSDVWRNLQGYKVTVWKLFDNCGVHFVGFRNLHIFMLVEKRYPLTPITISNMLNKKLQADCWNEIFNAACAQLQLLSDYYCWKEYADRDEIKD